MSVLAHSGKAVREAAKAKGGQKIHTLAPSSRTGGSSWPRRVRMKRPTKSPNSAFSVQITQPPLHEDIESLPREAFPPRQTASTLDQGHGRIDRRALPVSSQLKEDIPGFSFPAHQQVFRLERTTSNLDGSPPRTEVVYGITSLSPEKASPERLLSLVRGHGGIESLHWIRDVVFGEDKSPPPKGIRPGILTLLRNLAIALLRLSGRKKIAESWRPFSWKASETLSFLGF